MKQLNVISRILVGVTFIFSGFVKGIDPWGSAYKFTDYFNAMGLEFLTWAAFPLGVLLSFAEFIIGVGLLTNTFIRLFSWLALIFMAFFLPLTLWIAVKNPVTDCGCFGDALVISNWETFYKNVVLIVLTIIIFINRNRKRKTSAISYVASSGLAVVYLFLVVHSYNHLPMFDFRPYKVGVNIPDAMKIPENAKPEVYENIFYYKNLKSGEVQKFTEENYPWQDTLNWAFDNMESILVEKGYEPPIHDLTAQTEDGEDVLDFFIYDEKPVFMLIAHDLQKSSLKSQEKINTLAGWAMGNGFSFVCLTASLFDVTREFAAKTGAPYEFFNCDEITLKTIIRSNPGLLVIQNGTIIAKYHYNDIPVPDDFNNKFAK